MHTFIQQFHNIKSIYFLKYVCSSKSFSIVHKLKNIGQKLLVSVETTAPNNLDVILLFTH